MLLLVVVALIFVCCLPAHLAYTQYLLRRHAIQALIGDTQSRAALAAVFLNDCRNEVRELVDSGRCIYTYFGGSYIELPQAEQRG